MGKNEDDRILGPDFEKAIRIMNEARRMRKIFFLKGVINYIDAMKGDLDGT